MRPWEYEIEGEGDGPLRNILEYVAAADWSDKFSVTHYDVCTLKDGKYGFERGPEGIPTLLMGTARSTRTVTDTLTALAYPHDSEAVYEFVRRWLQHADPGPEPDTDGSNSKGWKIFTAPHAQGSGCYASLAVQPCWITYGK